jgi:hypothetical protein
VVEDVRVPPDAGREEEEDVDLPLARDQLEAGPRTGDHQPVVGAAQATCREARDGVPVRLDELERRVPGGFHRRRLRKAGRTFIAPSR